MLKKSITVSRLYNVIFIFLDPKNIGIGVSLSQLMIIEFRVSRRNLNLYINISVW